MDQLNRQYYTKKEACEYLRISASTLDRRIREGIIPKASFSGWTLIPAWFVEQGSKEPVHSECK